MTLRVSGKNMDVGDALRTKAEGHFDGVVKKYFDGGYTGHLTLEPEGSGFCADCMVHLDSGAVLQASAYGGDAISAYEILTETIEKRLRRYNRKLKQHRHHNGAGDDTALAHFKAALALDPDSREAQSGLGMVAQAMIVRASAAIEAGDRTQAAGLLDQAEALAPKSADLAAARARLGTAAAASTVARETNACSLAR